MDGMTDERVADLPCGEEIKVDVNGLKNLTYNCIFKQGHEGMHWSKLSWSDAEFWWGEGPLYVAERVRWTA